MTKILAFSQKRYSNRTAMFRGKQVQKTELFGRKKRDGFIAL